MSLVISAASHLDHGLSAAALAWVLARFSDRTGFFLETVELPAEVQADLVSALYGPLEGDPPVPDADTYLAVRNGRPGPSRRCDRPLRSTRKLTVIAGPHEDMPCMLYTCYGGAAAEREPWDPSLTTDEARARSEAFWKVHALSGA